MNGGLLCVVRKLFVFRCDVWNCSFEGEHCFYKGHRMIPKYFTIIHRKLNGCGQSPDH